MRCVRGVMAVLCILVALCVLLLAGSSPSLGAPLAHVQWTDPLPAAGDELGTSVAVSGDTALVGEPDRTVGGVADAGDVRVYVRSGGLWTEQAVLTSNGGPLVFGQAVAISADEAIIGAAGVAYIYSRSGDTWSQVATLQPHDPLGPGLFGCSVAVWSHYAFVGDDAIQAWAGPEGAAYVFDGNEAWSQESMLGAYGSGFGCSVAISGDTAVVGDSDNATGGYRDAGCAFWSFDEGDGWGQAQLIAADPAVADHFGAAVATDGATILVGAPGKTENGLTDAGAVYVFGVPADSVARAEIAAPDPAAGGNFGATIAVSGDNAVVGAPYEPVAGLARAGTAYLLADTAGAWNVAQALTADAPETDGWFGRSVGLSGYNVVVGAPGTTVDGLADAGGAYAYQLPQPPPGDASLKSLSVSAGSLAPGFDPVIAAYTDVVAADVNAITITGIPSDGSSSVVLKEGGIPYFDPLSLKVGANAFDVVVTATDGTTRTYHLTVLRRFAAALSLRLSGLSGGALKLGRRVTANGVVTPVVLAGTKITLTVQRRQAGTWHAVTSHTLTIGAGGAYSYSYKPARAGSYRLRAAVARTADHAAAATCWRAFRVT
jgi:hypothetical protein